MSDPTPDDVLADALRANDAYCPDLTDTQIEHFAFDLSAALAERGYRVSKDGDEPPTSAGMGVVTFAFPADSLDAAWAACEAVLPEGYDLTVGHTSECSVCAGWWATASKRLEELPYYPQIVSSETGRPRGEHHDPTPAAALRALAAQLNQAGRKEPPDAV